MHYDRLMEDALRGVVRQALRAVAQNGVRGDHHFYITLRTSHPGVTMPDYIRAKHPQEMTIVLQHQFWGLEISEASFAVTLSFNGKHERLVVPFAAVTAFVDPAVQFGLQFPESPTAAAAGDASLPAAGGAAGKTLAADNARVVALDAFRKK